MPDQESNLESSEPSQIFPMTRISPGEGGATIDSAAKAGPGLDKDSGLGYACTGVPR